MLILCALPLLFRPGASLIGPNYTAYSDTPHLATEASGRRACTLSSEGDDLMFILGQASNAFELRYSIPDAPHGGGLHTTLALSATSLTGVPFQLSLAGSTTPPTTKLILNLTSEYCWFYGKYPFSNDPSQGYAHHFYDEVRQIVCDSESDCFWRGFESASEKNETSSLDTSGGVHCIAASVGSCASGTNPSCQYADPLRV